jgi:hypothetical protein
LERVWNVFGTLQRAWFVGCSLHGLTIVCQGSLAPPKATKPKQAGKQAPNGKTNGNKQSQNAKPNGNKQAQTTKPAQAQNAKPANKQAPKPAGNGAKAAK